mmetsp:Transcript_29016/g.83306  ORF Transcript_29016/g.83306 Transcript_29016/m.83306 type:complete len:247 (+) Transcript_29016:141-881(+)
MSSEDLHPRLMRHAKEEDKDNARRLGQLSERFVSSWGSSRRQEKRCALDKLSEQSVLGNDVRGVELGTVREHIRQVLAVHAHPLCNRCENALPRVLRNEPPLADVLLVAQQKRCRIPVVQLTTIDAASQDEVVACPRMVRAYSVRRKRAAEVRSRHQGDAFKNVLCLQLSDEALQGAVDLSKLCVQDLAVVVVRVETTELDEEDIAGSIPRATALDQSRNLVQLGAQRGRREALDGRQCLGLEEGC